MPFYFQGSKVNITYTATKENEANITITHFYQYLYLT